MNDWSLRNIRLVQSQMDTLSPEERGLTQATQPVNSKSWNEELEVRVSRLFLPVKPSCERLS